MGWHVNSVQSATAHSYLPCLTAALHCSSNGSHAAVIMRLEHEHVNDANAYLPFPASLLQSRHAEFSPTVQVASVTHLTASVRSRMRTFLNSTLPYLNP